MKIRRVGLVLATSALVGLEVLCPGAARADVPVLPTFDDVAAPADISGEIAVDLRDDATDADVAALDARYGLTLRATSAWSAANDKLDAVDVDPSREEALIEALSADPLVEHAEPMALYRATFVPDDPLYAKQWHLARVGAERAWNLTCGRGVTVAVIDTGVACFDDGPFSRGTDLAGTRCEGGWNFVDDSPRAADDHGHGTHVAGTIAQTTNNGMGTAGLAFCATLMPVKVLSKQGFGSLAAIADGIRFAADHGANIINLSLGGPFKSRILEDAVKHAEDRGVLVVAAAGNSGKSVGYPAAIPGVLAVSATDDKDQIAWFSSRGPEVGISAPGVSVTQQTVCSGGKDKCEVFGTFNGTSMASPHVAGVAAMIESLGVTRPDDVRDVLEGSARAGATADPKLYGAGIVDAGAAATGVTTRHLVWRLAALLAFAAVVVTRIRSRGGKAKWTLAGVLAALAASVGVLPFATWLGLGSLAGRWGIAFELASQPLGEWDLLLGGVGLHRWLLLASALPALGLALVGFTSRALRPVIGGLALGTVALLTQQLVSGEASFVLGAMLGKMWLAGNAVVCLWLARVALDQKRV